MAENLKLVSDLALILISAGAVTILFKLLKQPLVLGYIVAGFLVGPHLHIFPTVTDVADIEVWSEIGIIFLLFALGLEFSFKKLFSVGSKAFVTALVEILSMIGVGVVLGFVMGWGVMESVFLGGMLAMSSTTIIIKAFEDMGLKKDPFVDLTMVVLIIQDIVAVVMMVLLSTAAASKQAAGMEMVMSIVKLLFFLVLWFVIGIFLIPTFFRKAKKYINDETLLIISLGLCFMMVVIANNVGFSSALGASVIGSILSETVESERIVGLTKGIKDLFGAVFFVSVGMMIDPQILVQYWKLILSLVVITLVVKAFASSMAALIGGASLKVAIQTGFTLSQVGEFAFIIASVGVSLKVMPAYIYPVVIAASVITTFTTPYWIKMSSGVYGFFDKRLSPATKAKMDEYSLLGKKSGGKSWKSIITFSLGRVIIFTVLSFAIVAILFDHVFPWIKGLEFVAQMPKWLYNTSGAVVSILLLAPFLYGIVYNNKKARDLYVEMVGMNRSNIIVVTVWTLFRFIIAGFFVFSVLITFFKYTKWVVALITVAVVIFILFSSRTLQRFHLLESKFISNLNAKDELNAEN